MNDDKLQTAINRAAQADMLLKHELLNECFESLKNEYIRAWQSSPARDTDGRERLWQAYNIVGLVKDQLIKVLNDGKVAKNELDRIIQSQQQQRRRDPVA